MMLVGLQWCSQHGVIHDASQHGVIHDASQHGVIHEAGEASYNGAASKGLSMISTAGHCWH